jgi:hypothetical protein
MIRSALRGKSRALVELRDPVGSGAQGADRRAIRRKKCSNCRLRLSERHSLGAGEADEHGHDATPLEGHRAGSPLIGNHCPL